MPRPATLLKTRLWQRCFPVNFMKYLRTPISLEHLNWLLLKVLTGLVMLNNTGYIYIGQTVSKYKATEKC